MTLHRALHKLRLKEGDILICRDDQLMSILVESPISGLKFPVPIIYAQNKNDLKKMSREELLRLIGESPST